MKELEKDITSFRDNLYLTCYQYDSLKTDNEILEFFIILQEQGYVINVISILFWPDHCLCNENIVFDTFSDFCKRFRTESYNPKDVRSIEFTATLQDDTIRGNIHPNTSRLGLFSRDMVDLQYPQVHDLEKKIQQNILDTPEPEQQPEPTAPDTPEPVQQTEPTAPGTPEPVQQTCAKQAEKTAQTPLAKLIASIKQFCENW